LENDRENADRQTGKQVRICKPNRTTCIRASRQAGQALRAVFVNKRRVDDLLRSVGVSKG
jgi:hypothetical protein